MTITITLTDDTGLKSDKATAWVAGWINAGDSSLQVLNSAGEFAALPKDGKVPFFAVADIASITLDVATNGNDRLLFVVSKDAPTGLTVTSHNPIQFTQYPYVDPPGVSSPGPFDVFEFGMDAQFDLSAVNGFALNLRFSAPDGSSGTVEYGVTKGATRAQIASAYQAFIANETKAFAGAADFGELLYDAPISTGAYQPPLVAGQYFAICDPNDMLAAKTANYTSTTTDPLATFWDKTLTDFFAEGNILSINLSANPADPNIYSGMAQKHTNPLTGVASTAYQLSNGTNTYLYFLPLAKTGDAAPGLTGAQYVFQQAFGNLTPAGSAGDAGLLQDAIWEALCRGVAQDGVMVALEDTGTATGLSTTKWNDWKNWYKAGRACHFYGKFLHCSDIDGNDSRISGKPPIFYGGAAYGYSMDEDPLGPYSGPTVPSKTPFNVSAGTVSVTMGAWS